MSEEHDIHEDESDCPAHGTLIWLRNLLLQWERSDSDAHGDPRRLRNALRTLRGVESAISLHFDAEDKLSRLRRQLEMERKA